MGIRCPTMLQLLLTGFIIQGALGATLLEIAGKRSNALCCQDSNALSCHQANVDVSSLGQGTLELPNGIVTEFSNMVPGAEYGYHYVGDNSDVVLTYNPHTGGVFGHWTTGEGRSFVLENCGNDGHVFKEYDVESFGVDETVPDVESNVTSTAHKPRQAKGIVTYTVKVYYTPEFKAATPDIEGFVDQVITETNQGYMNSQVNLRIAKHCTELATINDDEDTQRALYAFRYMKGNVATLRGSADSAAILLAKNDQFKCGIAFTNTISSGLTVSLTVKGCALGYYSFGHELGHNIGLAHDPKTSTNTAYAYGHGHLIEKGTHTTGFRTILAYNEPGHSQRVNYYSNPLINYPITGTPTGDASVSDNARLLNENAVGMAAIGDESETCGDAPTGPTSSNYCGQTNKNPVLKVVGNFKKVAKPEACQSKCLANPSCEYWKWKNHKKLKKRTCLLFSEVILQTKKGFTSGTREC